MSGSQQSASETVADSMRPALKRGDASVANLLLVECGLNVIREGGDMMRERSEEEKYLILSAATKLLDDQITSLQSSLKSLWEDD